MRSTLHTDVLVVGLGPGGASAAIAAAKTGCKVIALERNANPGLPVQCAEFVPLLINADAGHNVVGKSVVQNIDQMETFVESDSADVTPDFRGQMINRDEFDQQLVDEATNHGADCRFSSPVRRILEDGTIETADGEHYCARVIIGADGPRSTVGRHIGSSNTELVETRQIRVPLNEPHTATDIFLSAEIPGGYGWLFPKGDVANLGLGVIPSHKHVLKPALENLHAQLMNSGRLGHEILAYTGGLIPVGGIRRAEGLIGDRLVLLVGDAAGLTNPVTGAGINSAVISGRMAAEAAVAWTKGNVNAGLDYEEDIKDLFGPSIDRALRRRRRLVDDVTAGLSPDCDDLRSGWIAYPQYWKNDGQDKRPNHSIETRMSA